MGGAYLRDLLIMGALESLNVKCTAPLNPDLQTLTQSTYPTEPLSLIKCVWQSFLSLSPSLPYTTLSIFSQANDFLSPNQAILIARHFEVRGAGTFHSVNTYEYISLLTLTSNADWVKKGQVLFRIFDFDGSNGLSREEVVILVMSVYGGIAKATGQTPPTGKHVTLGIDTELQGRKGNIEISLEMMLDYLRNSSLFPLISRVFVIPEVRRSVLQPMYRNYTRQSTTPGSTHNASFSRKSSHFSSRLDYSPSVNTSVQGSTVFSDRTRVGISLPPAHKPKGLIIVPPT